MRSIRASQQTSINSLQAPTTMLIFVLDTAFSVRYEIKFYERRVSYIYHSHYTVNHFQPHLDICVTVPHYCFQIFSRLFCTCVLGGDLVLSGRGKRLGALFLINWFCIRWTCWCVFYQKAEWAKVENLLQNWRSLSPTKPECSSFIPSLSVFNTYTTSWNTLSLSLVRFHVVEWPCHFDRGGSRSPEAKFLKYEDGLISFAST